MSFLTRLNLERMNFVLDLQRMKASATNEVPVTAALFTSDGQVLCVFGNTAEELANPMAHAEMQCLSFILDSPLREDMSSLTLVVTLEPCPMCAWTIGRLGIGFLVFGAYNQGYGAAGSKYDLVHDASLGRTQVYGGVQADDCAQQLRSFFASLR